MENQETTLAGDTVVWALSADADTMVYGVAQDFRLCLARGDERESLRESLRLVSRRSVDGFESVEWVCGRYYTGSKRIAIDHASYRLAVDFNPNRIFGVLVDDIITVIKNAIVIGLPVTVGLKLNGAILKVADQ